MATWSWWLKTSPVRVLISVMRSISSPKKLTRKALPSFPMGKMSKMSPRTRKVPRWKSRSFRWNWMSTRRRMTSSRLISMPGRRDRESFRYSSGSPRA